MPGHTLDEMLAVIDEEIAGLQAKPRRRGRAGPRQEPDRVRHRPQPGEPAGARRAAAGLQLLVGDPGFLTEDLRRYRAVDAAGRAAGRAAVPEKGRARGRDRRSQSGRADHGAGEEMTRPRRLSVATCARRLALVARLRSRRRPRRPRPPPAAGRRPVRRPSPAPAAGATAAGRARTRDARRALSPAGAAAGPRAELPAAEAGSASS